MVFSDKLVLISSLTGLISLARLQNMFFSNLVAKTQCSDCIYFIWGRESAAKYNSAVAAGAASFRLYYYSLVFDDSPRAQCQQASAGTGFAGGGGIYCLSAGGGAQVHSLACSLAAAPLNHSSEQLPGLGHSQNICEKTPMLCSLFGCYTELQSDMM